MRLGRAAAHLRPTRVLDRTGAPGDQAGPLLGRARSIGGDGRARATRSTRSPGWTWSRATTGSTTPATATSCARSSAPSTSGTLATWPLALVRHAHAVPRGSWSGGDDRLRPLDRAGEAAGAARSRPLLGGLRRDAAGRLSDALRCADTLGPVRRRDAGCGCACATACREEGYAADPTGACAHLAPRCSSAATRRAVQPRPGAARACWTTCAAWPTGRADAVGDPDARPRRPTSAMVKGEVLVATWSAPATHARVVDVERYRP